MAKAIIMCGGSGGAASDDCTALKSHVLAGKTAVTKDSGDEPVEGTMPEQGNWNGSVGMNGSITIPEGHHSGGGKVTGPAVTQRGAWTSRLGINGKIMIPEGYHNGKGYVDQEIPTQGALIIKPGTTAKVEDVKGKYMTGNITVPAVSVPASVIKNGHKLVLPDGSSVTGTKKWTAKSISAFSARGFNSPENDPGPYEELFTMPADGNVYYSGCSASYYSRGDVVCEIYKNETRMDERNINSSNDYVWRATMFNKSFAAKKGDVIKVISASTSGTHTISNISAVCVYFA